MTAEETKEMEELKAELAESKENEAKATKLAEDAKQEALKAIELAKSKPDAQALSDHQVIAYNKKQYKLAAPSLKLSRSVVEKDNDGKITLTHFQKGETLTFEKVKEKKKAYNELISLGYLVSSKQD